MENRNRCINCGRTLVECRGTWLCLHCNSRDIDASLLFIDEEDNGEYVFIECPGATLYEPGTNSVVAGVRFHDDNDPFKGFKIIGDPVYAPNHAKRRRIKREALGNIRRCQACQDYTVRMRRREGPDLFIPSHKYPGRKKLKSVEHLSYEP